MHHVDLWTLLFVAANLVIAAGYLSVPFLVLPYLPLTRTVKVFGVGLFLGCFGTHVWMLFGHGRPHPLWVVEHVVQAVCTWGFILSFRHMLRSAMGRRRGGGSRP